MNQEQFGQFWSQLEAPLKNQWGKFTDDDLQQIKGNLDTFNRTIETRYGEKKNEVSAWANRRYAHWTGLYQGYVDPKPSV
ncbi:MAG: general stress protein CsbD [Nitrospirae bacterium]|nr:general stress protein CsbD [Nitrospirota bacterium]